MGVYIKNGELPKNCDNCGFRYDDYMCIITGTHFCDDGNNGFDSSKDILDDCPLVEVKPHGDLIDRNRIIEEIKMATDDDTCPIHVAAEVDQILETAPTVIEAEE